MDNPANEQLLSLALEHHRAGRLSLAESLYHQALASSPNAEVLTYLGLALLDQGKPGEAISALQHALTIRPGYSEAHNMLGNALRQSGRVNEAIAAYQQATACDPNFPDPYNNLAGALELLNRCDEAIGHYRKALALRPDYPQAAYNLGSALLARREYDDSIQLLQLALKQLPDLSPALNNLGEAFKETGQVDRAIDCFRRSIAAQPDSGTDSNLLYALHFDPSYTPMQIRAEHDRWNNAYARPLGSSVQPHANDRSLDKRLRIGYVSADFRDHPAGRFVLPLLSNHDHNALEVFCYSSVRNPDTITHRLKAFAHQWREVASLSDAGLSDQIRADRIDILMDLSVHMAGNRLLAFARKPAPVQVTWLGYPGSSGLGVMDYRFSDPYLDPPGMNDEFYCEKTLRLPNTYWCYDTQLADDAREISNLKSQISNSDSHITFGSLNAFSKINPVTIDLWGRVLSSVPQSRLLMLAPRGSCRQRFLDSLRPHGVDASRVDFVDRLPRDQYMQLYRRIDIALETFPFNGHTTSFDALWMGVPVVSLSGPTAVSRGGLSILSNLGMADLVTDDPQHYVTLVRDLAADRSRLHDLRHSLRDRMLASPLTNAPAFARAVETIYRQIWHAWCLS